MYVRKNVYLYKKNLVLLTLYLSLRNYHIRANYVNVMSSLFSSSIINRRRLRSIYDIPLMQCIYAFNIQTITQSQDSYFKKLLLKQIKICGIIHLFAGFKSNNRSVKLLPRVVWHIATAWLCGLPKVFF